MALDPKMVAELAEMGVIIIPLDHFITHTEIERAMQQAWDEEYLLDRKTHGSNKEWTDQ